MPNYKLGAYGFYDHEAITVGATSVGLTASKYITSNIRGSAKYALVTVAVDQIYFQVDGTAADANGHVANVGDSIELVGDAVRNFRAIRVTNNATIKVTYAR